MIGKQLREDNITIDTFSGKMYRSYVKIRNSHVSVGEEEKTDIHDKSAPELSEYEKIQLENIRQRQEMFRRLDFDQVKKDLGERQEKREKYGEKRSRREMVERRSSRKEAVEQEVLEIRSSRRVVGRGVSYVDMDEEEDETRKKKKSSDSDWGSPDEDEEYEIRPKRRLSSYQTSLAESPRESLCHDCEDDFSWPDSSHQCHYTRQGLRSVGGLILSC